MTSASCLIAGTIVLAGCGGSGPRRPAAPGPEGGSVVRSCAQRAESDRPVRSSPHDVRVGPIVFYYLGAAASQPASDFDRPAGFGAAVKTAVGVDAGTRVTVAIPRSERGALALIYGEGGDWSDQRGFRLSSGQASVRFEACPEDEPRFSSAGTVGPQTQFAGGIVVRGAGCHELLVGRRRLRIGFGRPC